MFKITDKYGGVIEWQPEDKNLGIAIVKEVTGKTSTNENLVEVTEEQRQKILMEYDKRAPKKEIIETDKNEVDILKTEIAQLKEEKSMSEANNMMLVAELTGMIQKQSEENAKAVAELTNMMAMSLGGIQ